MKEIAKLHKETFGATVDLNTYIQDGMVIKKRGDELIGYVLFQLVADVADLHYIVIAPKHRQKGYGFQLMSQFLTHLVGADVISVTLEVRRDNLAAIKLYEAFDFVCIHIRKKYYKDGSDALLMEKIIVKK